MNILFVETPFFNVDNTFKTYLNNDNWKDHNIYVVGKVFPFIPVVTYFTFPALEYNLHIPTLVKTLGIELVIDYRVDHCADLVDVPVIHTPKKFREFETDRMLLRNYISSNSDVIKLPPITQEGSFVSIVESGASGYVKPVKDNTIHTSILIGTDDTTWQDSFSDPTLNCGEWILEEVIQNIEYVITIEYLINNGVVDFTYYSQNKPRPKSDKNSTGHTHSLVYNKLYLEKLHPKLKLECEKLVSFMSESIDSSNTVVPGFLQFIYDGTDYYWLENNSRLPTFTPIPSTRPISLSTDFISYFEKASRGEFVKHEPNESSNVMFALLFLPEGKYYISPEMYSKVEPILYHTGDSYIEDNHIVIPDEYTSPILIENSHGLHEIEDAVEEIWNIL